MRTLQCGQPPLSQPAWLPFRPAARCRCAARLVLRAVTCALHNSTAQSVSTRMCRYTFFVQSWGNDTPEEQAGFYV